MKITTAQIRSLRELAKARTKQQRHRWWARVNLVTLRALRERRLVECPPGGDEVLSELGRAVLAGASARRGLR